MKIRLLLFVWVMTPFMVFAQESDQEVPVRFDGDEEVVGEEEVEVSFDEEEETQAAGTITPGMVPEHEFAGWLVVLPLVCLALLAINVGWRTRSQEKP